MDGLSADGESEKRSDELPVTQDGESELLRLSPCDVFTLSLSAGYHWCAASTSARHWSVLVLWEARVPPQPSSPARRELSHGPSSCFPDGTGAHTRTHTPARTQAAHKHIKRCSYVTACGRSGVDERVEEIPEKVIKRRMINCLGSHIETSVLFV